MSKNFFARLFSPWDQLPLVAVIGLVFIYMATKGQAPPVVVLGGVGGSSYMSPDNLWNEAIVIGGFTWGLLFIMSGGLLFFARDEASGILSMLEPVRGMVPTGIMTLFFGLLASLTRGHIWVNIGLGLFVVFTIAGLIIALKKLPQLTPLNDSNTELLASARWYSGYFCVCKEDPRVLVPRRSGSGIALNLAHGRAWGVLLAGMALPLTLAIVASFGGLF
jgi:hypothetical protein